MGVTIWEIIVKGTTGKTTSTPADQLNGAPVLGYVFLTSLKPSDDGFSNTEGIVALALTSHPDLTTHLFGMKTMMATLRMMESFGIRIGLF